MQSMFKAEKDLCRNTDIFYFKLPIQQLKNISETLFKLKKLNRITLIIYFQMPEQEGKIKSMITKLLMNLIVIKKKSAHNYESDLSQNLKKKS